MTSFMEPTMNKISSRLFVAALLILSVVNASAGQIKVYVAPFSVTGAAGGDELKPVLQNLLMSRLSSDSVTVLDSAESADVTVKGSYIAFGKVYSLDAVGKSREGKVLVRAFEQGESQDEMLQAVGRLAKTLLAGIEKSPSPALAGRGALPPAAIVRAEPVALPAEKEIIRAEKIERTNISGWISQKLDGELVGIALGKRLASGERELFIAGNNSLACYRLGKELTPVAEIKVPVYRKILAVDSADVDGDGSFEIYLTLMNGEELSSEVWTVEGSSLKKIGEKLPYYFRGITSQGKNRIYAQQSGRDTDFYGDLFEVTKSGATFDIKNPVKLPRGGNIFNTNMIQSKEGKTYFVVMNADGYLVVFDESRKDLWKSSDKYGGSENFFAKEDLQGVRTTGALNKKTFLEQRITVTGKGEVIVPRNDGFLTIGDNRAYSKNSIFAFVWNGVTLEETWHTRQSQSYLSDYQYDDDSKELMLLEVVKKSGIFDKGASAISVKKVE